MDEEAIVSYEHIFGGFLSGVICFAFSVKGLLPITNEVIGVIISLVIVYALGKHAESKYGREKIGLGSWIMNGIVPFYFMWMTVWVLLFNYIHF